MTHQETLRAEADAARLLMSMLDPGQKREWLRWNRITVRARSGDRYCITKGDQGTRVHRLGTFGVMTTKFCVDALGNLPDADRVITLMTHIEFNERYFLDKANGRWSPFGI